jgi:hypothetical protein
MIAPFFDGSMLVLLSLQVAPAHAANGKTAPPPLDALATATRLSPVSNIATW